MNFQELRNEIDMLNGNINRMCLTDDLEELVKMYEVACGRLDTIRLENYSRITDFVGKKSCV